MKDTRERLPVGTQIYLESGSIYIISSDAIGFGGGSIVYPANRMVLRNGVLVCDEFVYALKECFPVCNEHTFVRNKDGEIVAETSGSAGSAYLEKAKQLQICEGSVSRKIYRTASRMLPVLETSCRATYVFPDGRKAETSNSVTVMESITEKGRSVRSLLSEKRRVSALEAFRIIQQLLFALSEVHNAGFLHLDIQDGNVFLRGSLEDNSEFLTLIDFGAARPMQNGKTAPIADKVIFTSEGFTAPEILLGNDGSLRLGPEADLYSVGCMLMLLLTGHRPNVRTLLYNKSGNYLTQRQLARVGCPRHLVGRLQAILAKALAVDEKDRYHSADEMLEAVADILHALQPYRTDLSSVAFDAFVCYKHGPIDSTAAVTLQRALENYHAPKDISGKRKPFQRVFVDEGELSSCADFGQQIREALKNSGWLIVICSPDTPSSPWVQLEIDTFLEYHDRSRILAVLTSGEPEESYPPQLKANADGMGEVLAADARGATAKEVQMLLKKDALLKVAAPMLGTSFDSLKQRQRVYRMQRAAVAASIALAMTAGFAAYAVNRANVISRQSAEISQQAEEIGQQAQRIEEEYRTSLINESRFLAEQAERRLEENDPIGAIELALQALPSDTQERPVIPEAEYVLSKALGIHLTPGISKYAAAVTRIINPKLSDRYDFLLNESGNRLILYNNSNLQVWDAETITMLYQFSNTPGIDVWCPRLIPQRTEMILKIGDTVLCSNYETGETQWETKITDVLGLQIVSESDTLIVFQGINMEFSECREINVLSFSAKTGEQLNKRKFILKEAFKSYWSSKFTVSPDGKWGVFHWADLDKPEKPATMVILDLVSGEILEIPLMMDILDTGIFGRSSETFSPYFFGEKLMVLRCSGAYGTVGVQGTMLELAYPSTAVIELYDLSSGIRVWYTEYSRNPISDIERIEQTTFGEGNLLRECALVTFDNECRLIDLQDGSVLKTYRTDSAILDVECDKDTIRTINANGEMTQIYRKSKNALPDDTLVSRMMFSAPISHAIITNDAVFTSNQRTASKDGFIHKYHIGKELDNYSLLAEAKISATTAHAIENIQISESGTALTFWDSGTAWYWNEEKHIDRAVTLREEWKNAYPIGISDDDTTLYLRFYDQEYREYVIAVNLIDGGTEKISLPSKQFFDPCYWHEGYLFTERDYDTRDIRLNYWRFSESEPEMLMDLTPLRDELIRNVPKDKNMDCVLVNDFWLDEQSGKGMIPYYLKTKEGDRLGIIELDLETGSYSMVDISFALPEYQEVGSWAYNKGFYRDPKTGNCIISSKNKKYITNPDGELLFALRNGESENEISSEYFFPNGEIVAVSYESGIIEIYRLADGVKTSTIDLRKYTAESVFGIDYWEWTAEGRLLCYSPVEAYLLDISGAEIKVVAVIPSCVAYDPYQNRYLIFDNSGIGQMNCLSLNEMIARGQKLLGR